MRKPISNLIFLTTFLLISVVFVAVAQACEVNADEVIAVVDDTCGGIGSNEVCYGNYDVSVVAQASAPEFTFAAPGDLASLGFVRSLVLSALDPEADIWGIAQMRLLATTSVGTQDVTLLLFGDVSIESAVEETETVEILVGNNPANIRSLPSNNGTVLFSAEPGTGLKAVGRLADTSWLRVQLPNSESIGWIFTELVAAANQDATFDILAVQEGSTPHYGTMQAFYYTSGSNPNCANMASDGLIIQTPSGNARVNLLINEVSIELIGGQNGATAFITANPQNGMTVNMVDGTGIVTSNGTSYFVNPTNSTNIPMSNDMSPNGNPSIPDTYNVDEVSTVALLPVVRDPDSPEIGVVPTDTTTNTGNTSGTSTGTTTDTGSGSSGSGSGGSGSGGSSSNNGNQNGNANGSSNSNANGNATGKGSGKGN